MRTQRLYYDDPYTTAFSARVVERTHFEGQPAIVLDRSYFYPTSGGQPHDLGTLEGVPVLDVVLREADDAVLHVLERELPAQADNVHGEIDWARRFDHMQHHTGQHVLTQAFIQVAGAHTVGFHLSAESVTIDLDKPALSPEKIEAAEALANRIVTENRAVRAWFPQAEELARLPLRKVPDVHGKFRVVQIADFDVTACGGTHVAHSGEIGLIKVLRAEKRGDTVRIEFRCGGRALRDYAEKHALLSRLSAELTTAYTAIPDVLAKLREENKALRKELKQLRGALLRNEAQTLWEAAEPRNGYRLVLRAFEEREVGEVRQIVQQLIAHPATVAICAVAGPKAQLIAARSDDLSQDMVAALKRGLAVWGAQRGGGRPSFAQGGGVAATLAQAQAALQAAAEAL